MPEKFRSRINIRPYFRVGDGTKSARITNRGGSINLSNYSKDEVREADDNSCDRLVNMIIKETCIPVAWTSITVMSLVIFTKNH